MNKLVVLILIVTCRQFLVDAQDTIKSLPQVIVNSSTKKNSELSTQEINREDILRIQPQDVGVVLQKVSGTSMKSYGGLGGMKTISIRGLGGQHTAVIVDDFFIGNTQNGQLNLASVQTDNIEKLALNNGAKTNNLLPVSTYVYGSVITISTFENNFGSKLYQTRFSSKIGSFGEVDNYLSFKVSKSKLFLSAFGKYRQANGKYAYTLNNGKTIYSGIRENNDFKDWYSGVSLGFLVNNKSQFRLIYRNSGSDQGLPGPIILYNSLSNQRLTSQLNILNCDFKSQFKSIYFRLFYAFQNDEIHYSDPSFLNQTGGIESTYQNTIHQTGLSFSKNWNSYFHLYGGVDTKISKLDFNTENASSPNRIHSIGAFGLKGLIQSINYDMQVSSQSIIEQNASGERAPNRFISNPFFSIENEAIGKMKLKFKAWYKNSFRIPTFNELYYNGIGNVKLKPEEASQYSFGFSVVPIQRKFSLKLISSIYYSEVKNQILAIPTKNLFVWSMQNIGIVHTSGNESRIEMNYEINPRWTMDCKINYTYQKSLDFSSKNSPTFKNQVAYIPVHSGNGDLSIQRKNSGIQFSIFASSLRYALNENIPANIVDGFLLVDVGLFTKIKLFASQEIRLQFTMKNCLNTSYAFVNYYVMPGRNGLFSLNYAF